MTLPLPERGIKISGNPSHFVVTFKRINFISEQSWRNHFDDVPGRSVNYHNCSVDNDFNRPCPEV